MVIDADKLKALKRNVLNKRRDCYEYLNTNNLSKKRYKGESTRSKEKVIYFINKNVKSNAVINGINLLKKRILRLGYEGLKTPRSLWLPTIIENADEISVIAYPAYSKRKLNSELKEKLIENDGSKSIFSGKTGDYAKTRSGRNYKIRVTFLDDAVKYYPFSKWVICVCKNKKLPVIKKMIDKSI